MSLKPTFELMSTYNQWMNNKLYEAAAKLSSEKIKEDQGAFFRSILGTLNHILVADILWLKRFAQHPKHYQALSYVRELVNPSSLDQILYDELPTLAAVRRELDQAIIDWCQEMEEDDLSNPLDYANSKGIKSIRSFGHLIQHFFNHQTHHRGQVTTLLNQNEIDVGTTDLLMLIPDELKKA